MTTTKPIQENPVMSSIAMALKFAYQFNCCESTQQKKMASYRK